MKVVIDLDRVLDVALQSMSDPTDLRWSIGMALQELYWDEWMQALQGEMVETFSKQKEPNNVI
jgi:hypothetical protein